RDLDTGEFWSAGLEPAPREPVRYHTHFYVARAELRREDEGIALRLEIEVSPDCDGETRRVTLTNRSARRRRLEVTTYAEVVLGDGAADAAHPAFSKLFVQTAWAPEHEALLAWRRPRSAEEPVLWLAHALAGPGTPEYETDRARFIGRGHDVRRPRALDAAAPLSGTVGNVLDPVVSMRRVVELAPGEDAMLVTVLAAAGSRDAALAAAARLGGALRAGGAPAGASGRAPAHPPMASPHEARHDERGGGPEPRAPAAQEEPPASRAAPARTPAPL